MAIGKSNPNVFTIDGRPILITKLISLSITPNEGLTTNRLSMTVECSDFNRYKIECPSIQQELGFDKLYTISDFTHPGVKLTDLREIYLLNKLLPVEGVVFTIEKLDF